MSGNSPDNPVDLAFVSNVVSPTTPLLMVRVYQSCDSQGQLIELYREIEDGDEVDDYGEATVACLVMVW